ncbi:translation initiation factor IF-2 [Lacticaseibacillus brantae]|uniref:Translation initiation factor IF-2 n=1 Tax=Lacticaseibacillus brantae DSM 23927 TaxID=1423727 RepID=A0A0R2B483_9LACO|nr:translation initiation factor IF-2 [Lacticaseibacillus brantae]KRM72756.1 infB protein [Lacticaseibacillus brantae DSM 23927]
MGKKRVYEFAKEINLPSKAVIEAAGKQGIQLKNHMSSLDDAQEKTLRQALKPAATSAAPKPAAKPAATAKPQHDNNNRSTSANRPAAQSRPANSASQSRPASNNGQSRPANNGQNRSSQNGQNRSTNNQSRSNSSQSRPSNNTNRPTSTSNNRPNNTTNQTRSNTQSRPATNGQSRPQTANNRTQNARPASTTSRPSNNGQQSNNNNRNRNNNSSGRGGYTNNNGGNNRYGNNNRRNNKKNRRQQQTGPKKVMPARKDRPLPETLVYTVGMNAQDLGKILHREPAEIIKKLFMLGVAVNQNQSLDKDTIEVLAADYGINAEEKVEQDIADLDTVYEAETQNADHLSSRPPVVTIMGHVDHGKTTLLDNLRHSHVTEGEAGGITQHIGAYQVKLNDRLITFLDTPGHAAFTNMRARGADITDIIVLVVAADDGVMPQTIEAINHAKAANAPIIVAVNKIDKPGANPTHVMEQLAEYELIPESWGGDTIFVEISAKFGKNIDELLEMILLEADVLELKANPDQKAVGTVIEARLDKGKGSVTTLLVQQGTLRVGDPIVVGNTFGRVRVMTNDRGRRVKEALPSTPVEITGLNDVPQSADRFVVFDDEKTARAAGEERAKRALDKERQNTTHVTLDNLFESMKQGQLKEVDVIIKGDVQGSVEALAGSLRKIDVEGVRVNIIHQAVGAINESDVTLASASNAIIIGFNVRPTPQAKSQAESEDVDIRLHRVIYKAIEEIESAMKGMLEPVYEEKVTGSVTVRETINVSKIGTVAGAYVDSGYITRDSGVRLIRDGIVIYEGKLASLRRFKDDVKEVRQGFELGLTIENYNDIKIDDQIEAYVMEEVPVK